MGTLKRIGLSLAIIGAINWGLIGLFQFDLVATLFGGQSAFLSRVIYALVGIGGLISLSVLLSRFEEEDVTTSRHADMGRLSYGAAEFAEEDDVTDSFTKAPGNTESDDFKNV